MSDNENVIDVSEESFDTDVLEQSWQLPIVVDFWAPWCAPCRTLGPILQKLAHEPDTFFVLAKVNADENPNLSIRYGIRGIPAVKVFFHGEIVGEFTGVKPEPIIRQFLKKVLPNEEDYLLNEAMSLLATRHWRDAEDAFRDILEEFPDDAKSALGLATALLAQGFGAEASDCLKRCKDGQELIQAEKLSPLAGYLAQYGGGWESIELAPIEMQYRNGAKLLAKGNYAACMDGLIELLRQNKRYRKGLPRKILLALFELLGNDDDLTQQYRRELAMVMY